MHLLSSQALAALLPHISVLAVIAAAKLGVIMPLVVATLSQPRFSPRTRTGLSIVSCLAASAIVCLSAGVFSGLNWAAAALIMLATTWSLYEHFYKPIGLSPWVEKVTTALPYLIAAVGGKVSDAFQNVSSVADNAIAQSQAPIALPAPAAVVTAAVSAGVDTLSAAAAQAEDAESRAADVAQIADGVATRIDCRQRGVAQGSILPIQNQ